MAENINNTADENDTEGQMLARFDGGTTPAEESDDTEGQMLPPFDGGTNPAEEGDDTEGHMLAR